MGDAGRPRRPRRPWRSTALAGAAVVTAGLATARFGSGAVGDALYAALVLLLVRWALPRWSPAAHAALAVGLCWAVEVAQATGGPAQAVEAWPPLRYLLGTTFGPLDLLWYALGVLAAWGVIVGSSRRRAGTVRAASDRP
jgi:uncharacterized protein DUF2809